MSILDLARKDFQGITESDDWASDVTLNDRTNPEQILKAWASKHHFGIDPETGLAISTLQVYVRFSEQTLVDAGFTVRNANKEVAMLGWKVSYTDSSGNLRTYQIDNTRPDETVGQIICFLKEFE